MATSNIRVLLLLAGIVLGPGMEQQPGPEPRQPRPVPPLTPRPRPQPPPGPPAPPAGPQPDCINTQGIKQVDLRTFQVERVGIADADKRSNREHPCPGPSNLTSDGSYPTVRHGVQQNVDKCRCDVMDQDVPTVRQSNVEDEVQQSINTQGENRFPPVRVYAVKYCDAVCDGINGELAGTVLSGGVEQQPGPKPRRPRPPPPPPPRPRPQPPPPPPAPPAPPAGPQAPCIHTPAVKLVDVGTFEVEPFWIKERSNREHPHPGPSNLSLYSSNASGRRGVQQNLDVALSNPGGKLALYNVRRRHTMGQDAAVVKRPKIEDEKQQASDAQGGNRPAPLEVCTLRCSHVLCNGKKGLLVTISWKIAPGGSNPTPTARKCGTTPFFAEIQEHQRGPRAPAVSNSQPSGERACGGGSEEGGQPDGRDPDQRAPAASDWQPSGERACTEEGGQPDGRDPAQRI